MKIQKMTKTGLLTLAVGVGLSGAAHAAPVGLTLNGQPLITETSPLVQNGRVLVPMRDIFESLGATVSYNNLTREIAAQRGTTVVRMTLGSSSASLNNVPVTLDVPATAYYGRTMVPLRFVSEAMGANVDYDAGNRLVAIRSNNYYANNPTTDPNRSDWRRNDEPRRDNSFNGRGDRDNRNRDRDRDRIGRDIRDRDNRPNSGSAVAGFRQITVPADAVVKVTIDNELSSANATVGQIFTATVVSSRLGDSEFPAGTKLRGQVVAAERRTGNEPGALELRFTQAVLPDNSQVNLDGVLVGLDSKYVQNVGGRVVATGEAKKDNSLAVIGIGTGAGFLIGKLLDKNELVTALLGAGAGYLYNQNQNKGKVGDAVLTAGQEIGVRLRSNVTYRDTTNYYDAREDFLRL
jgi:hypothetical protein